MTLFTLAIFLASIWSLALYSSRMLRNDLERQLSEQQFAAVSLIGANINNELALRLKLLAGAAASISPAMMDNATALQARLLQLPAVEILFNGGALAVNLDGTAIAEVPRSAQRIGINYRDRDYLIKTLTEGKPTIGQPVMGKKPLLPVFDMAVPIRNAQGKVIGALVGVINLGAANFLNQITDSTYGKTGGAFLITPQNRMIVAAFDKSRIMEVLPAPGVNPWIDRFMQGYEGSAIVVNPHGLEVLVSVKQVPIAGWYTSVILPTAEAFASIDVLQQRMLLATLLLSLLAGGLTWWMLRRELSPLLDAAKVLTTQSESGQPPQALPIARQDEIGDLIGGFNHLLETLGQREAALKSSEKRFQALSAMSSDWFWQQDEQFRFVEFSGDFAIGFTPPAGTLGRTRWELNIKLMPEQWATHRAILEARLPFRHFEYAITGEFGEVRWYSVSGEPLFDESGRFTGYHGTGRNISDLKATEQSLRIAAAAFESQEGMVITDAAGVILRINRAFTAITGYTAEEAVGQTPRLLKSGRHSKEFYRDMWETIGRTGGWQGEVWDRRKNGEIYPKWLTITAVKNDDGAVTHYIGTHFDITERKQAEDRIEELAFFDQLTGLPNRTLLLDRLNQAMTASSRNDSHGALLFIDLDHFKTLNDTLGHDMGDLLLRQVAQRLTLCVREGDTVARLGGDEFVVMLANLSENERDAATGVEAVAEKILAALNQAYQLNSVAFHSTASVGVTLFRDQLTSIDDLMKQADLAMYKAKEAGRNAFRFFDPAMESVVKERAALEEGLRRAVAGNQFVLHYQAQVVGKGRAIGAEALVRWQHPDRGMVSPAEFIPLAEETGIILPLGHWVLETACTQLAKWAAQPEMAHLTIAVNVSAQQIKQPDFVNQVLAVLKTTGADPRRLKLELTESLLVHNVEEIIQKMFELKAAGVGFALDDFGTGYSSLSYLKRLPLDQLKIDQSFVRDVLTDPNDAAIARTVVALAQSLGLAVIAEGVETEAQRDFLASEGCHAYQGYFFSRPLPIEGFEQFARQSGFPPENG
ncbi:MAG: EAL domain-containing protein [Rhodocyclales bacterium]|nr:EAL domain-containing protein [Rhodocyclales bacterium]